MPEYTQDALFSDAEVVGTGRTKPWPQLEATPEQAPTETSKPFKIEWLPQPFTDEDAA